MPPDIIMAGPKDTLQMIIEKQFESLPPIRLTQYRANLLRLQEETEGRIRLATGCSGTDLVVKILQLMVGLWQEFFGLSFRIEHVWSCDHGSVQQKFILEHFQPHYLFTSMEEVATSDTAYDLISGKHVTIESFLVFATGIECDTLSSLNRQKQIGESIVDKAEGKTGSSARYTMQIVEKQQPDLLLFECVRGLAAASKTSSSSPKLSDIGTFIVWGNRLGYVFWCGLLEATEFGSSTVRTRQYMVGFRCRDPDAHFTQLPVKNKNGEMEELFELPSWHAELSNMLGELKVAPLPTAMHFLPLSDSRRVIWRSYPMEGSVLKVTAAASEGNFVKSDRDPLWEADHLSKFTEVGIHWPPQFTDQFIEKTAHLCRHKAELVYFMEQTVPWDTLKHSYADINYTINWIKLATGKLKCLVGSLHVWYFGRALGTHHPS